MPTPPPEPPAQGWEAAQDWEAIRAALWRKQDSQYQAELDQIAFYQRLRGLLLNGRGESRFGARGPVERRLGVKVSLSRYIEGLDPDQMLIKLQARRAKELADRVGES